MHSCHLIVLVLKVVCWTILVFSGAWRVIVNVAICWRMLGLVNLLKLPLLKTVKTAIKIVRIK